MTSATIELDLTLDELRVFLPNLIEACDYMAEQLYVHVTEGTWQEFSQLLQAMNDLYKLSKDIRFELENTDGNSYLHIVLGQFISEMEQKFKALNQYMDEEAYIHAADSIRYELSPLFLGLSSALGEETSVVEQRFSENLLYLQQHYPDVYNVVKDLKWDREKFQVTRSINGQSNIYTYTFNGNMSFFYSNYDQHHEIERWKQSIRVNLNEKSNVIVYGFGLGAHLVQLCQQYPHLQLVIMEPDEQFLLAAMRAIDIGEVFSKLHIKEFFVGDDKRRREGVFYRFFTLAKGETEVLSIPFYDQWSPAKKKVFVEDAKTAVLDYISSVATYRIFGMQWIQNRLNNFSQILNTPSIEGLKGTMEGVTAVIVGAGPSLEEDIEQLRKLKSHALIIAAGTAIQSLKHFGIDPHLIVSMDGSDSNYAAFKNQDIQDIPFLFAPQVQYKIIENNNRLFHLFLNNDLVTRYMAGLTDEDPVFGVNHSVSGIAIRAAIYMGCSNIVFTGQDLSYSGEKKYAVGAIHAKQENIDKEIRNAELTVKNVQGTMNRSSNAMFITLRDIEDLLSEHPNVKFINTSQRGAAIKYTEWRSLEQVLDELADVIIPPDFMIESMAQYLQPYNEIRIKKMYERLFNMPEELNKLELNLKRMENKLKELKLQSRTKPKKCLDTMVDIEDIWEIVVSSAPFITLITTVFMYEIRNFDRDRPEMEKENNIIKKADLFDSILGTLISSIQARLPELSQIVYEAANIMKVRNEFKLATS
ncbi:6-hydroxymethylpterin diphosphokinase MptE-like protein [Paenibacillus sepulcri]|uniref:DUF115 domain-containing protein n=1 Tax=Paenibacillus sepulcri TaxID=359917 RepID=A0ABS7BV14_9BACL|nr:DUF115 domain-containing protein [Paenibacillus sepulcri]